MGVEKTEQVLNKYSYSYHKVAELRNLSISSSKKSGMMPHKYNLSPQDAEAGELTQD